MDGARARDGLDGADAVLGDGRGVGAHEELLGGGGEGDEPSDGEVFVEGGIIVNRRADLGPSVSV